MHRSVDSRCATDSLVSGSGSGSVSAKVSRKGGAGQLRYGLLPRRASCIFGNANRAGSAFSRPHRSIAGLHDPLGYDTERTLRRRDLVWRRERPSGRRQKTDRSAGTREHKRTGCCWRQRVDALAYRRRYVQRQCLTVIPWLSKTPAPAWATVFHREHTEQSAGVYSGVSCGSTDAYACRVSRMIPQNSDGLFPLRYMEKPRSDDICRDGAIIISARRLRRL